MIAFRDPATLHAPVAAYSHQVEVPAGARWLVLSGQIGVRSDGSVVATAEEQLAVALDNIRLNLDAAGMTVSDLVKLTIYLVGDVDAARRRAILGDFFGAHRPALTLLFVAALAAPAFRVEIDAWAAKVDARTRG